MVDHRTAEQHQFATFINFIKLFFRLKEELEWRDSGHGDDLAETEDLSAIISDRDRDSDSVQMKPSIALKSWTWRSSPR